MKRVIVQNWFLLGLLAAVGLAFLAPGPGAPGGFLHAEVTSRVAVALIFFAQGLVLAMDALRAGLGAWRLHLLVQVFTYLLIPLLALALDAVWGRHMPADLRLGFLFLAVLPTTVSSAVVFTALADGNTAGALVNATLSNLLGVLVTPVWVSLLLEVRGETPRLWPLVQEIALLILLPLVIGLVVRLGLRAWADRHRVHLSHANSVLVLFIVYAAFCGSVASGTWTGKGWSVVGWAVGGSAVFFVLILVLTWVAVRATRLGRDDAVAALFCAPQKTLAAGAPMAELIFAGHPGIGLILLPVMAYHPLQLLASGALVNVLKRDSDAQDQATAPPV